MHCSALFASVRYRAPVTSSSGPFRVCFDSCRVARRQLSAIIIVSSHFHSVAKKIVDLGSNSKRFYHTVTIKMRFTVSKVLSSYLHSPNPK